MAWKILTGISTVLLIAAGTFSWFNKDSLLIEQKLRDSAYKSVELTSQRQKVADDELAETKTQIAEQEAKQKKISTDVEQKQQELAGVVAKISTVSEQVKTSEAEVADLVKKVGDIAQIQSKLTEVAELTKSATDTELAKNTMQAKLDNLKNQKASTAKAIADMRDLEGRQKRGVVDTKFQARISAVYPNWGFCVINKGEVGGVYTNADLEIRRGSSVVGKLKVTGVEANQSIADYSGGTPSVGDLVVAGETARKVAAADEAATAAPAAPAGAPPAAEGSSPFGAPAPGSPPAAPPPAGDPFGGAAPAAPTPPPPGGTDAAPAAPATPAAPDPFAPAGGAAAPMTPAPPAAGGAMAPMAPAGTTPPVDPFAPKPQ